MMSKRNVALFVFAAALTAVMGATAAPVSMLTPHVNDLTFSHAVALPGVTLAAGTYTFESGPAAGNPNIVRVTTKNGQRVLYMGFTIPLGRPTGASPVVFGEAVAGAPTPIVAWYPIGSSRGFEFRYR